MNHEKLVCNRLLLSVAERLSKLMARWPVGYGYLADQLRRAMASSILTLAEGNGKRGNSRDRRRFFQMSMGSVAEVAACLDLASVFSLISAMEQEELKKMLKASYFRIRKLP